MEKKNLAEEDNEMKNKEEKSQIQAQTQSQTETTEMEVEAEGGIDPRSSKFIKRGRLFIRNLPFSITVILLIFFNHTLWLK